MSQKIFVATGSFPIMEYEEDPFKRVVLSAILLEKSITEEIFKEYLGQIGHRVDNYYNYAKNHYELGLPQGYSGNTTTVDNATLEPIIQTDIGAAEPVQVDYAVFTTFTLDLAILPYLSVVRGFDPITKRASNPPGGIDTTNSRYQYTRITDFSIAADQVTVTIEYTGYFAATYDYEDQSERDPAYTETTSEQYTLLSSVELDRFIVVAKYQNTSGGQPTGDWNWWYYDPTTEKYPALNTYYETNSDNTFLPIVPIRYNNVDLTAGAKRDENLFITSEILLRKIGLSIDSMADQLNANPQVGAMDHAYIGFFVNLTTTDEVEIRYLAEYFDYLHDLDLIKTADFIEDIRDDFQAPSNQHGIRNSNPTPSDIAEDHTENGYQARFTRNTNKISLEEHGLDIQIAYNWISSTNTMGVIGPRHFADKTITSEQKYDRERQRYIQVSSLVLRYQYTPTKYKTVTVHGLELRNYIYNGMGVSVTLANIIAGNDEGNFLIPVHYGVAQRFSNKYRDRLYKQTYRMIINSVEIIDLEWYQEDWFQLVVIIVAIIIIYFSWGSLTKEAAALISAIGAGGAAAVVALAKILGYLLLSWAIRQVFMYIIEIIGVEWGIILAVVLAITSLMVGDGSNIDLVFNVVPTATACIFIAGALLDGTNAYIQAEFEELNELQERDRTESERIQAEIDDALIILGDDEKDWIIDPLTYTSESRWKGTYKGGDTPSRFYERCCHIGSPATVSLDVIGNFVELKLQSYKEIYRLEESYA